MHVRTGKGQKAAGGTGGISAGYILGAGSFPAGYTWGEALLYAGRAARAARRQIPAFGTASGRAEEEQV